MTVIVDEKFIANSLGFDHETFWTEGAEADDLANDPVARDTNRGELSFRGLSKGAKPASLYG
jgi:hypothetical protein